MLEKLDKIAPFLALALMGFLVYSTAEVRTVKTAQAKDKPRITREMLHPRLIEPVDRASPAGRDPFDVDWASYLQGEPKGPPAATQPEKEPTTTSAPSPPPTAMPVRAAQPPPLPTGKITALIVGDAAQFVVIEERIYKPGEVIRGPGAPGEGNWSVETIGADGVVLRFGELRKTLSIAPSDSAPRGDAQSTRPRPSGGPQP